jgi:D-xylose transport system substrate-binding protein
MRKSAIGIVVVGVAASLVLSACSSSKKSTTSSSTPATSTSAGASSGAGSSSSTGGKGKVGVILPDTTSSTRYTTYDAPLLTAAFKAAGIPADIQNAGGSTAKFQSIAQSMFGEGVTVLIMDSLDPTSGAAVEQAAKTAGVKVIDYDRVNLGGSADYYVSFDNQKVGVLQGQTLVSCLSGVTDPQIIEMDGGTDTDNNAVLFKAGAQSVLNPLQAQGKLKIVSDTVVKGWDVNLAAPAFTQALTANGNKVDGVLAANDDIANAVIGVLKSNGLAGKTQVTGQDSGVEGLQNIITGNQCMTIFKDVKQEANAASKLAVDLINGTTPTGLVPFQDPKGNRTIQAVLLTPTVITKKNVQDVITAGALTQAQICKGITAQCAAAGLK